MHTTTGVRPSPAAGRLGHSGGTAPASSTDGLSSIDDINSSGNVVAAVVRTNNKEALLSSSDTDDCDAPDKLVIDLDGGAGQAEHCISADTKPVTSVNNNGSSASRNAMLDGPKSRAGGNGATSAATDGLKSSAGAASHHRVPVQSKSAAESTTNENSNPANSSNSSKGLKMKIKCSQTGGAGMPVRHEVSHFHTLGVAAPPSSASSNSAVPPAPVPLSFAAISGDAAAVSLRLSGADAKPERDAMAPHARTVGVSGSHRKDHRGLLAKDRSMVAKDRNNSEHPVSAGSGSNSSGAGAGTSVTAPVGEDVKPTIDGDSSSGTASVIDPYEFNVKTEDSIGRPAKKIKLEKCEAACSPIPQPPTCSTDPVPGLIIQPQQQQQPTSPKPPVEMHDAAVDACHVGVVTDPDCLGPCEPGTTVTLEGIVWNETENGLLVVNVTWRGKTYVGTLMDATKHHWAPPRFATESPTSDLDGRTPKGRGKRGRTCATSLRSDFNGSDRKLRSNRCAGGGKSSSGGPGSPARSEPGGTLPAKRPRVGENNSDGSSRANSKSSRSDSRMSNTEGGTAENSSTVEVLKECPAPNCNKKFRHINGLQYHQSRAHPNMALAADDEENEENDSRHHHNHQHHGKTKVEVDDLESVSSDGWRIISNGRSAASPSQNAVGEMHDQAPAQKDKKSKSEHRSGKSKRPTGHSETAAPSSPKATVGNEKTSGGEELPSAVNGREKSKHKKKDRHKDSSSAANVETSKDAHVATSAADAGNLSETSLAPVIKEQVADSGNVVTDIAVSDLFRLPSVDNGEGMPQNVDRTASNDASSINRTLPEAGTSNMGSVPHSLPSPHSIENTIISPSQKATSDTPPSSLAFSAPLSEMQLNSSLTVTPSKKPKSTPTKPQPVNMAGDIENPNSPAYSDISDANDSAPMLEKEATPSCAAAEEDDAGNPVRENRPLSRHLPEGFGGPFGPGQGSAMLYGQPPCLTPAVIPPGLDGSSGKPMIMQIKSEKGDSGRMPTPDDRPVGGMVSVAQRMQRPPGDQSRPITDGPPDMMDRNMGGGMPHRSASRPHPNDLRSPHSPAPPMMPPANMYMYPYVGAGAFPGFDAALLMQHPEYRAHYERLIQQEVTRRHDLPAATTSRPPDAIPTDAKGYPILPRPGDLDRRGLPPGKSDLPPLGGGSLPTPPSLIPDRGLGSFDDQDGNIMKSKGMDRRDDRMFIHQQQQQQQQQQYAADRQRGRHDEQMMQGMPGGKDGAGKPSAVVAPQARDRTPVGPGSSKPRPDDSPRPSSDRKPSSSKSSGNSGSSHSDMQPPRTLKDLSDRGGPSSRDDKGLGGSRSGQPFKLKEEGAGSINVPPPPIVSQSLPMSVSFPTPYFPYIPGAPQYAGAPLPFDPTAIYSNMNPIIGYASAPPGSFLHPAQMGYLPSVPGAGDVAGLMQPPPGAPLVSPLEGKPRDLPPPRGFYPNDGPQGPPLPSVHKIHELKEVAKGTLGSGNGSQGPDTMPGSMGPGAMRDPGRPESRGGPAAGAGVVGGGNLQKDHDRGSPPMQRHLHTHHHMHMLGPPFISFPGDPAMMSSPQSTAPTIPRPYIGK